VNVTSDPYTVEETLVERSRPQNRRRFSFAALLGLAFGVALLAVGAIGLALSVPSDERNWQDLQFGMGRSIAQSIAGSLRRIESSLDLIAAQDTLFEEIGESALDDLRARESSLAEIVVVDIGGHVSLHSGDEQILLKMAQSFMDAEWIQSVRQGRVHRAELKTLSRHDASILIVLPSGDGGMVAGRVSITELWFQASESAGRASSEVLLLGNDGRVLANGREYIAENLPEVRWEPAAIGTWISGDEWAAIYEGRDGERVAAVAIPVRGIDWSVIIESPVDQAYGPSLFAMVVFLGGAAIALVSLVLSLVAAFSRRRHADDEVIARLEDLGPSKVDLLALEFSEGQTRSPSAPDPRHSVLKRAREYELAMSDLRKSQERYALAVRGANDGLWDWDLNLDQVYFSARWKAMLGHLDSEVGGNADEWIRRVHEDDREQLKLEIRAHLDGIDSHLDNEHRMLHRDGYFIWVRSRGIAVRDHKGAATRMAGVMTDITDRKRNEEQWHYDALHDSLTGLANRALFLDRLGHALDRAKRTNQYKYAVLFLDLDQFKAVNDRLGHVTGDKLLIAVANRLMQALREVDTIARLGGDEFVILLDDIEVLQDATTVAGRIHLDLKPVFELDGGHEIFTSTSIGVVLGAPHYDDAEQVLRDADTALYRAKELGRARSAIFDEDMRALTLKRLRLENDLRKALEDSEIRLVYDPVASCADLTIRGVHALVHWSETGDSESEHGDYRAISEDARLMLHVGEWAIEEACRQRVRWWTVLKPGSSLFVSIGLSAAQLRNPDLLRLIRRVIRDWPTDARNLAFEIRASAVDEDREAMKELLEKMASMGFQLHLTGSRRDIPASEVLKELPFDVVKIGPWYIDKLVNGEDDRERVRKIVREVHQFGRKVLAEGVETEDHFTKVKELGCDYCQGSYISQKLDNAGVVEFLRESMASKRGLVEE
jgi:diguanylate cyclase (GGDEF)-like protein/PAS domain S-box-containing protein